jgi:ATP-dependent DNA helicase PIF1
VFVNGSLGYIIEFHDTSGFPIVEFDDGSLCVITPHLWEKTKGESKVVIGSFEQLPLRHAWAITIHKSQGQSFDDALINMGSGAFAAGQTYVALSRVRTLDGVHLSRALRESDVFIDPQVERFVNSMT